MLPSVSSVLVACAGAYEIQNISNKNNIDKIHKLFFNFFISHAPLILKIFQLLPSFLACSQ